MFTQASKKHIPKCTKLKSKNKNTEMTMWTQASKGAFTLALLVRTRVGLTSEFGSFGWCERCHPTSGAHPRTVPESTKKDGLGYS